MGLAFKFYRLIELLLERSYFVKKNMPLFTENWQITKPTIRERTKFMLNNEFFSDVKFVARKSDGESESKQLIPAHKFVLTIGSPVFEVVFYGELAETRDSIELPDCGYESLFELFRYMYSDEMSLSGSNVEVLHLAKKHMVPSPPEGGGGVLPYMGYIGMYGAKGYGFSAVLVINRVSLLAILLPFW